MEGSEESGIQVGISILEELLSLVYREDQMKERFDISWYNVWLIGFSKYNLCSCHHHYHERDFSRIKRKRRPVDYGKGSFRAGGRINQGGLE